MDLNVEVELEVDLNANVEVDVDIDADVEVEIEIQPEIEIEIDVQPETELEIEVDLDPVVAIEIEGPTVEVEIDAPKAKFDIKAQMNDMKKNFVMDVEIGGEFSSYEEVTCGFCCKEMFKALGTCFGLFLSWILITVLVIISVFAMMLGVMLIMFLNGFIKESQMAGMPKFAMALSKNQWVLYVFGIVLPILFLISCSICCWCILKKKKQEGNYNGIHSVFSVPNQYRFVDLDHGAQVTVEVS